MISFLILIKRNEVIPKIKEITENNKDNLLEEKDFQELGLVVRIYGF